MKLRAAHLGKTFDGQTILSDLTFEADVGVTCLCAPSGIGKTTLLRILLGIEAPTSGESNAGELRFSAVFQEDRLLEHLDAKTNLRLALGADYDEAAAEEMLARLALTDAAEKKVRDYSGGMKRRLALARALLARADAIALDEPFTGLDEENIHRAIACISDAAEKKIVLLTVHDADHIPLPYNAVVTL